MEYNFFYPEMRVTVGPYKLQAGIHFEVCSSKETPIDWAEIRFTDVMPPSLPIAKKAEVLIELGYGGKMDTIFSGQVQTVEDPVIRAKDRMQLMKEAVITGTFLEATPEELLTAGVRAAGIASIKTGGGGFSPRSRVVIRSMDGLALLGEINRLWGLKHVAYTDTAGVMHWAADVSQEKIYRFVYGENIIDLERRSGNLVLTTIAAGFIRHSHRIEVQHPDAAGIFEALKVRYYVTENGFPRTEIWFKGAAA